MILVWAAREVILEESGNFHGLVTSVSGFEQLPVLTAHM
jgi:hypothetical protein